MPRQLKADPDPRRYAQQQTSIALTTSEIRRLLNTLIIRPADSLTHLLHWSNWRCHHQSSARRAQYRHRFTT
jgi:hypothetical protein